MHRKPRFSKLLCNFVALIPGSHPCLSQLKKKCRKPSQRPCTASVQQLDFLEAYIPCIGGIPEPEILIHLIIKKFRINTLYDFNDCMKLFTYAGAKKFVELYPDICPEFTAPFRDALKHDTPRNEVQNI